MEIKHKLDQPLLSRTWVSGTVAFDGATPSNDKMAKDIASSLKTEVSLIVMKSIRTGFGKNQATFEAAVYKDAAAKERAEVKTKRQKEAIAKATAEAKKAADEAKAAAEQPKAAGVA